MALEGLWCGKVPEGVSQEEPPSKLQIRGAHDRDQQVLVAPRASALVAR